MEFGILGPLEVRRSDDPVAIPGAKQRVLLAALLVHAGETLSSGQLAEILWSDDQPANPRNALQSQVSQLRRLLGPDGRDLLSSQPTGYALETPVGAIDAARFEAAVRDGRRLLGDGDPGSAAAVLRDALRLWRGPALAEFSGQPFADPAITRLEELRLAATEDRIDADLATGRHVDLVPELEALVAAHPLRERLRGQLMLALYRCGRQADALQVFHDTRAVLEDELGIDPSPELTRRYEALLRQEDDAPTGPAGAPPPTSSTTAAAPPLHAVAPPAPLSSFVGRDEELTRVLDLVRTARLVTLTGPGGVGKTRLATEAARTLVDDPVARDGVWFVELAAVTDPDLMPAEVAAALGLHDAGGAAAGTLGPGRDAATRLADALRHRQALLVLDNCEHLVDAAAGLVRDLLAAASELTVLTTTREPIGVTGETVWSVPSLAVPPDTDVRPDELLRWGAPRLLVDRLRSLDPTFVVDDRTASTLIDVCRRLDGIPLALELAAARVRTLGLDELAARLDDRFRVLTAGDRTARPRQRTLRAVVEWSWDLLDEREQALFRRLSVFSAGATLEAMEAVCGGDPLSADEVLDVAASLVDKSVVALDGSDQPPTYRMLETLRAFGEEQLEASGEAAAVRSRHAERMIAFAVERVPHLRGPEQLAAMREVEAAQPDLRAALHWLASSGDADGGARLAAELGWFWYLRGARQEALRWLSSFADAPADRDRALATVWRVFLSLGFGPTEELRAEVERAAEDLLAHGGDADVALSQLVVADIAAVLGDGEALEDHLTRARDAAARAGDEGYAATADFVVGHGHVAAGRFREAEPWMEAANRRFAGLGDRWGQVQSLMALVGVAEVLGDLATAVDSSHRGLELARQLGLREMEGILHARLAMFHALADEHDDAWRAIDQLRPIVDELGSELMAANLDLAAGVVALRADDLDTAERHLRQLLTHVEAMPMGPLHGQTLARLGLVLERRGQLDDARRLHAQAIEVARSFQDPRSIAFAFESAASTLASAGDIRDAAVLLGAADARRRAVGLPLPAVERGGVDRTEAVAREHLGDDAFEDAFDLGATMADADLPVPTV